MNAVTDTSPALAAAREADRRVAECLKEHKCFLVEAGAGAGKTFSLVESLRFLITTEGPRLRRSGQQIACITYTNAATAVISSRIDGNPVVFIDTIHAFCWSLIKGFQSSMRTLVATLPDWQEKLTEAGGIGKQHIDYDLGHRRITDELVSLHHDDVLALMTSLLPSPKFQALLASRFPFVLIDEYQDTNLEIMTALQSNLIERSGGPLIGLFGDHWQRIYEKTCGHVARRGLVEIGKKANFRSATSIVNVLNKMRPELPQEVKDVSVVGSAEAYHTNTWIGTRRTGAGGGHWKGDLPADVAHQFLEALISKLKKESWDFSPDKTKILMLTHNVLASEQGYANLARVFTYTDHFIKKEDDYIAFFADKLEPAIEAFQHRRYGEMMGVLGEAAGAFSSHADKLRWSTCMNELAALRLTGNVGDIIDRIRQIGYPKLPDAIIKREDDASAPRDPGETELPEIIDRTRNFRTIPYTEVIALDAFVDGHTPFATKHSVKGDEFENVLVVVGRGWNRYNFEQYLEWAGSGVVPSDKADSFERNRNLFYVACSRPTTRLALLFTQQLSDSALGTLTRWFGTDGVRSFAI